MLDRNEGTRIGFYKMLNHPVFVHLDWNKVANLDYTREHTIVILWVLDGAILTIFFQRPGSSLR